MKEVTIVSVETILLSYIYINKYGTYDNVIEKIYYLLIIYKTYMHHTQF